MNKKKVIFDCDCTYGVKGCDVDDGMALMYLLSEPSVDLIGILTTYGNSREEIVYAALKNLLFTLGRTDIPVLCGGKKPGAERSEAADFLVDASQRFGGELSLLCTGSVTNLGTALRRDAGCLSRIREQVFMGGITEPLRFQKRVMDELNFSCDPKASLAALINGRRTSVITGNHCLRVLFTKEDYRSRFGDGSAVGNFIRDTTDYWFLDNEEVYGIPGFYNWDITAAAYLCHPELFTDAWGDFSLSEADLSHGFLRRAECGYSGKADKNEFSKQIDENEFLRKADENGVLNTVRINLPEVKDSEAFKEALFSALGRLFIPEPVRWQAPKCDLQ